PSMEEWQHAMFRFAERHKISIGKRYRGLTAKQRELLWKGDAKAKGFMGIVGCCTHLARKKYKLHVRVFIRRYQSELLCPDCNGARLNREALSVFLGKKNIAEFLSLSIQEALLWVKDLELSDHDRTIAQEGLRQVTRRLEFLNAVGVGYLTLSRLAKTLSGGEY